MAVYCVVAVGGLVQRHGGSQQSEASGYSGPVGGEADLDIPDREATGYDDDQEDSKSMRLTLMEEVLLLGLKDREVRIVVVVVCITEAFFVRSHVSASHPSLCKLVST